MNLRIIRIFEFIFFLFGKETIQRVIKFNFKTINNQNLNQNYYEETNKNNNFNQNNEIISFLLGQSYYFNLSVGTPPKITPVLWNMDQYTLKFCNKSYNSENSETKKKLNLSEYNLEKNEIAFLYEDIFYFFDENKKQIKSNFNFFYLVSTKGEYAMAGLKLHNNIENDLPSFLDSLKKYNVINQSIFFISFNNSQNNNEIFNYEGEIIVGDYPHNIKGFKDKYEEYYFYEANVDKRDNSDLWILKFSNIYIGKNSTFGKERYFQAKFLGNFRLIIGSEEYETYVINHFFSYYLDNEICDVKTVKDNNDYYFYVCKNDKKLFDMESLPELKFESKELYFNITLNYKDLFFVYNNELYFAIIFDKFFQFRSKQNWVFGSVVFRKYQFVFNQEKNKIGVYTKEIKDIKKGTNIDNNNLEIVFKIILIISIGIIVIIIGALSYILIVKYLNMKQLQNDFYTFKSRAHEIKNKDEYHDYLNHSIN